MITKLVFITQYHFSSVGERRERERIVVHQLRQYEVGHPLRLEQLWEIRQREEMAMGAKIPHLLCCPHTLTDGRAFDVTFPTDKRRRDKTNTTHHK